MYLDLPFLANEALLIFEKNLDIVPLELKTSISNPEQIFDITIELKKSTLKKSIMEIKNELILPACLQLVSHINNQYPVNGCEFTNLSLSETINGCVQCYKGISVKLIQFYDIGRSEMLSIIVGVSKNINPVKESNTMINPVSFIVTNDELTFYKKGETLTIENVTSHKGDDGRSKTFNKRELKKVAKFIVDSVLTE